MDMIVAANPAIHICPMSDIMGNSTNEDSWFDPNMTSSTPTRTVVENTPMSTPAEQLMAIMDAVMIRESFIEPRVVPMS